MLGNSELVLCYSGSAVDFKKQLYVIEAAQLISRSFICDIFLNISSTKAT